MKTEENVSKTWVDHRLTNACKYGFTVIYDEFNRSRPEANNVLLGILEERLLEMPVGRENEGFLNVHPAFRAIFTSNPEEYAGVHKTQEALLDRMITITVGQYDRETEVRITAAKSGSSRKMPPGSWTWSANSAGSASCRCAHRPGVHHDRQGDAMRAAAVACDDRVFLETCRDVLRLDAVKISREGIPAGGHLARGNRRQALPGALSALCPRAGTEWDTANCHRAGMGAAARNEAIISRASPANRGPETSGEYRRAGENEGGSRESGRWGRWWIPGEPDRPPRCTGAVGHGQREDAAAKGAGTLDGPARRDPQAARRDRSQGTTADVMVQCRRGRRDRRGFAGHSVAR